jgi:two-component system osmolarity sensor histidine kinase EnvZ
MKSRGLKRYLPRNLYGRAALILILPVVVLQLVVSIVFIQRHFEDVTRQMTSGVALEIGHLIALLAAGGGPDAAGRFARDLEFDLAPAPPAPPPDRDRRLFYDLSGLEVIATLRAEVPGIRHIDLATDDRVVTLRLATPPGEMQLSFSRRRVSASNPHQLLVLMIFTGLLMTLIAIVFLRNQLRPIRRLARAAEAFGKGRTVPYSPSGAVEVRSAGQAFLDMRGRIERQIEQRTLMLSGVSHDLRTPLTRMKLGLSMIEPGPETAALKRDLDDMEKMLEEFLAFAQHDTSDVLEPTDPVRLAESMAEDARRSGQQVEFRLAPGTAPGTLVPLRPMAVRRALANLMGNAARYGTRCRLGVAVSPAAVRFTVEDDGPGIPEHSREMALRPFTRLEEARNQDRGTGVGLGLAITLDIARAHGGTLRLGDSADLGGLKAELVLAR